MIEYVDNFNEWYNHDTMTVGIAQEFFFTLLKLTPEDREIKNYKFVALTGTPKQISWANSIRYERALEIGNDVIWINQLYGRLLEQEDRREQRINKIVKVMENFLGNKNTDSSNPMEYIEESMKYVNTMIQHMLLRYTNAVTYIDYINLYRKCSMPREREAHALTTKNIYQDMIKNGILNGSSTTDEV